MKLITLITFCCLQLLLPGATQAQIQGEWVGGSDLFQNKVFIQFRFSNESSGVANISQWRVNNRPLVNVSADQHRVHFEFPSTTGVPYIGEGEFVNGNIEGTISRGDQKGKFHLVRLAKVSPAQYEQFTGAYEFINAKGEKELSLITYSASGYLRWVNLMNGQTSPIFPSSDTSFFFAGAVVNAPATDAAFFNFKRGKAVVKVSGQPDQEGLKNQSYHVEQVTTVANNISLSGTLIVPGGTGKFPVVVAIPGSQAMNRDDTSPYEEFHSLISNGVGIFVYDKRGTGLSTGDWQTASFEDLARDVNVQIDQLKKNSRVDGAKIGVWGFSQGAGIGALAASQSNNIAFVIMQSGGGISSPQAEIYEQVARMQVQKYSEAEIKEAVDFMHLQFDAVRSAEGWNKFQAAIPVAKEKRWYRYTWGGIPKESWLWKWWIPVVDYDPSIALKKIKVPVLVLLGSADQYVPTGEVEKIAALTEQHLKTAGNTNVTVKVFEGANHEIFIKQADGKWALAPLYDETLKTWITKTVAGIKR